MKAQVNIQPTHPLSKVVTRLVFLGSVILGCVYVILEICSSLLKAIG